MRVCLACSTLLHLGKLTPQTIADPSEVGCNRIVDVAESEIRIEAGVVSSNGQVMEHHSHDDQVPVMTCRPGIWHFWLHWHASICP